MMFVEAKTKFMYIIVQHSDFLSHTYRDSLKQLVPMKRSLKSIKCDKVKGFIHLYDCNNYNLISSTIPYSLNKGNYDILTKKKNLL